MPKFIYCERRTTPQLLVRLSVILCLRTVATSSLAASTGTNVMVSPPAQQTIHVIMDGLRQKGYSINFEPTWSFEVSSVTQSVQKTVNVSVHTVQEFCELYTNYVWQKKGQRYTVCPVQDALCRTRLPAIIANRKNLLGVLTDRTVSDALRRNGLFPLTQRGQNQLWTNVDVILRFTGGTFGEMLDSISDQLGSNVCWSIDFTKTEPIEALVGNKIVHRPFFKLHFAPTAGTELRSVRQRLESVPTDELKRILERESGMERSDIAFVLACRYLASNNQVEAIKYVQRAIEVAESIEDKWQIRYDALVAGIGYLPGDQKTESNRNQYEAFIRDCVYAPVRQQAMWTLLTEHCKCRREQEARRLIESAVNDADWQFFAARHFKEAFKSASPIPERPYIRTTVTNERNPDGSFRVVEKKEEIVGP